MSDPNLEEESLISQDDIDKLLDASSIEDAEAMIDETGDDGDDDFGELSQDDIDSLLSGGMDDDEDEEDEDEGGELSQDDIDSLLGGADEDEDEEDGGELSQDDIDSLLGGGGVEDDTDAAGTAGGDDVPGAPDADDMELISQDDIDRLMNPSGMDDGDDFEESLSLDDGEDDDDELISMDDIQGVLNQSEDEVETQPGDDEPPQDDGENRAEEISPGTDDSPTEDREAPVQLDAAAETPLDIVIDETDASDVSDCLITQETMDALIQEAGNTDAQMPADVVDLEEGLDDPDTMDFPDGDGEGDDDLDLLGGDLDTDTEDDVTQEDIDALLQDSDDDDDFMDEDILISQDDIDTLLMAADQEDEDILGETLNDDDDDLDLGDLDEDDFLDSQDEAFEQVVLEGGDTPDTAETDGEGEAAEEGGRLKKVGQLFKSKLVIAALSAILVLGISVPTVYFLFFSKEEVAIPEKQPPVFADQNPGLEVEVESVDVGEEAVSGFTKQAGTMEFTDFVILASDRIKKMTYVYADISIDYSDQRAYHEMSSNSAFYRDLIYDSIKTRIGSEKGNEVTEADLIWGIETSLKKVLPPHYIEKVSFKSFRTG